MATIDGRAPAGRGFEEPDIRHIGRRSPEYPERLRQLRQPPDELWALGSLPVCDDRAVAVVGTRRATEYGRRMAADIAAGLAAAGWTIVSGLARGIDAAAHRGALDAGGRTLAVLGCGVDLAYPASNRGLYHRIRLHGSLLSEFAPGTPPLPHHFPQRNRIIAALSRAVVVVQAGRPSGALITADLALDMSREVLAVPGPADQAVSRGVHRLIQDGAGLVTCAEDVLAALGEAGWGVTSSVEPPVADGAETPAGGSDLGAWVVRRLREGPASLDDICGSLDVPVPVALSALGKLDVAGTIRVLPGHRYELVRRA